MKNYQVKKGLISQKIGTKIKIFDGESSLLYSFNDSASLIFENLKKGLAKETSIEEIVKKYKIDKNQASADYDELINELKKRKIIA